MLSVAEKLIESHDVVISSVFPGNTVDEPIRGW